jgi:hypothetical protein
LLLLRNSLSDEPGMKSVHLGSNFVHSSEKM